MAIFKITFEDKKLSNAPIEYNKLNPAKYLSGDWDGKFICEYINGHYQCIPKYSKGNKTIMDFVIEKQNRFKIKFYNSLSDALQKSKGTLINFTNEIIVDINFIKDNDKLPYANLQYGFNSAYYDCITKEPGMKTEKYRLHKSIEPCNKTFTDIKSNRIFTTSQAETLQSGLHYKCNLLENNKIVAELFWESYYKD